MSAIARTLRLATVATLFSLATCATAEQTDADAVNLARADVMAHISGNTETWTKGGGYYAPDGKLHVLWEGEQSVGTWEVSDDGEVCYVVDVWGPDKECHSYIEEGDAIKLLYQDQSRVAEVRQGNQLDAL